MYAFNANVMLCRMILMANALNMHTNLQDKFKREIAYEIKPR